MNIIIVGTGGVGKAICAALCDEGHNITLIDKSSEKIDSVSSYADVSGVVGSGADIESLKSAGAEHADLLIAVTSADEVNLLCCYAATKLGTKHTIARVRNHEYMSLSRLAEEGMGLSLSINPDLLVANEILRILRLPSATKVDTFCHGQVETVEFSVDSSSVLIGKSLHELREMIDVRFLVIGIRRENEVFIPTGNSIIMSSDTLVITTAVENTSKFFKAIKSYKRPVKSILIVGAGRTSYYLAKQLKRLKIAATFIERSRKLCSDLSEACDLPIINADGTKREILAEEGLESADAFLALSNTDEENAIVSMIAKQAGVPKVVTLIRSLNYVDFFKSMSIGSIVCPRTSTVDEILRFVRSRATDEKSEIKALHKLMNGDLEVLEFLIRENIPDLTGIPIYQLSRRPNTIIVSIMRQGELIIPSGNDVLLAGDSVIIAAMGQNLNSIKEILK